MNIKRKSINFNRKLGFQFFLILILFTVACASFKSYEAPKIIGLSSWEEWIAKTGWTDTKDYFPEDYKISRLKSLVNENHKFIIFATTFCDDCRENLPKIIKILNSAAIPQSQIRLYGLDYDLSEPSGYYNNFVIPTTPSLFVLRDNKILGSMTYPEYNWLDGIIKILENNN